MYPVFVIDPIVIRKGLLALSHHEDISALEQQLNSFHAGTRLSALKEIATLVKSGKITVPASKREVNLHFHTFFSFNANAWSPSRIAWESKKYGLEAAGIVDFDVLDGMDEFLAAGEQLEIKAVVGLESRVFISEWADKITSSPNEPGVSYFMAEGCFKCPPTGSESVAILLSMSKTARDRNLALIALVNDYLAPVRLKYETDAVPLTPAGNVTERHLLAAYDQKARHIFDDDTAKISAFWAEKLGISLSEAEALVPDTPKFHEKMRSKLMKFGGVGYIPPSSGSFPSIEDAVKMIRGMEAIPMIAWLDGTNDGEEDADAFLELLKSKGVVACNIIPDRNWNIKNPDEKGLKVKKLGKFVAAARANNFPIAVGTEMNKAGLPFVDGFSSPELAPYVKDFIDGANLFYAHTILSRYVGFGYLSDAMTDAFGDDIAAKNRFFTQVGEKFRTHESLVKFNCTKAPSEILQVLE